MAQMDHTNNDAESYDHNQSGMDPRRVDDVVSHNATIGNVVVDTVVDAKNDDSCTRTISDTKKRKSDLTMEDDTTNNLNQQQLKQPKVVVANHRIQEQPALIATATNNNNTDNGNIINHPICIPITPPTTSNTTHDKIPEWAMIELNGELIKPSNGDHRNNDENSTQMVTSLVDSNSYELGTIQFMNPKEAMMIIGTHEIKGAVEKLDQPYCVLQKNTNSNCDETNQRNTVSSTTIDNTVTTTTSYELVGVVTSKILFKNYPKTIVRR